MIASFGANLGVLHFLFFSMFTPLKDIRHPEELSLLRPVEEKKKKKDKNSEEEIYDITDVPLTSGRC